MRERGPLHSFFHPTARQLPGRVVFAALNILVWIVSAIALVLALSWIDQPFPGFLLNQRMAIGGFGGYHWTGTQAGLQIHDKILAADGTPVRTMRDLERVIAHARPDEPITYTVHRGDDIRTVTARPMRFGWLDLLLTFGVPFLSGVAYLTLGFVVYMMKPDTRVSWAFLLACVFLGAYTITAFDVQSTHWGFVRLYALAHALIPAAFLHLSLVFPEERVLAQKHPWVQALPYPVSIFLAVPFIVSYPDDAAIPWFSAARVYMLIGAVAFLGSALLSLYRRASTIARQRAKVILFGAAIAFPLPAFGQLVSQYGVGSGALIQNNFLALPILLFPAAISYSIVRHNLFDVDVYIKRAVGYLVMTVIVGLTYFSVQTVLSNVVLRPLFGAEAETIYPVIFALLVVFFFNPVNRRVQQSVDTLFFRKLYDYKATVSALNDALSSGVDLEAFVLRVSRTVTTDLFIDRAGVLLLNGRSQKLRSMFIGEHPGSDHRLQDDPSLSPDDPLLTLLARERKLITKYDIAEDPRYADVRALCGRRFSELRASLALPLFYREDLAGAFVLGYKKSGYFYSREDVDLLKTVSAMISTAIEQDREKGQRATLMQLFSKHVSPQVAESLWDQRDQFLDGGRPRSQSLVATVMFTDLQGFTSATERLSPDVLMDWLNTYMEMIARLVMDYGGVVDDYFGDGVKVNFGVPVPRTTEAEVCRDAVNAVNCALALEREMRALNARMQEQDLPPLRMRVGIHTGSVIAGSLGSADRLKYTTLGDTVNTAARLESFDKDLVLPHLVQSPCRILIGEPTLRCLGDEFTTQPVGVMALKGKAEKIPAHCVLGRTRPVPTTAD